MLLSISSNQIREFVVVLGVAFFAWVLILAIPAALLFALLFSVALVPAAIVAFVALAIIWARKFGRAAIAIALMPIAIYLLVGLPTPFDPVASHSARWLQFAMFYERLASRVESTVPGPEGLRLIVLDIDGFVPSGSNGIIYDSTRQSSIPRALRSPAWSILAESTELSSKCDWTVEHLLGPYFSYSSSC
jgi:hypothetical protein